MKHSYKHEQLTVTLRKIISTLPPGARLPSVRSIIKRYEVSLPTVNSAIRTLADEKQILVKKGSGIFVRNRFTTEFIVFHRRKPSPQIKSGVGDKESSLYNAITSQGWQFYSKLHGDQAGEAMLFPEPQADAHIIFPDLIDRDPLLIKHLRQQKVPLICLGRESEKLKLDYIVSDEPQIFSTIISHLKNQGHRKIAFLINEPRFYEIEQRIKIFQQTLETQQLPPGLLIDCKTPVGESSELMAYKGLHHYLSHLHTPLPFTAIVLASAHGGLGTLRAFHENHIHVPTQCSIVAFGLVSTNALTVPKITEVGSTLGAWGESTIRLLKQRFSGDFSSLISVKIPGELYDRESVAPPPRQNE